MAGKSKERSSARFMYVEQGIEGKEIAAKLNVSENTLSGWVTKYGWKAEREARINSLSQRAENIKRVISSLSEQALELQEQRKKAVKDENKETINYCDVQSVGIADQVSKWNKALASLDKNNRITLDVYLQIMDEIFNAMQVFDNKLFLQTINFQEAHIQFISTKLG